MPRGPRDRGPRGRPWGAWARRRSSGEEPAAPCQISNLHVTSKVTRLGDLSIACRDTTMSTSLNLPEDLRFDMKSETAVVEKAVPFSFKTDSFCSRLVIHKSRGTVSMNESSSTIERP